MGESHPSFRRDVKRQKRICLHCDSEFQSTGPGNRICSKCHTMLSKTRRENIYNINFRSSNKLPPEG